MNLKTSESLLPCYCPGRRNDSRVEKAVRVAEGDGTLKQKLDAQRNWDGQIKGVIHSIEAPADLLLRLSTHRDPATPKPLRSQLFNPGMLAVVLGVLVLIAVVVVSGLDRREHFQGREQVVRMLDVTRHMSGVELEPVDGEAWQLGDWFYMKGFEGYALPGEVAKLPAVGSRVFRQNGHPIAQVALGEHDLLVFIFRASTFGVELPESNDWRLIQHEGWAAAIRRQGGTCTMLARRGSRSELKALIADLRP